MAAPGLHEDQVYPAAESLPAPLPPADSRDPFAAGRRALDLFGRWNWKRSVDARLALGAWGCLVAGAPAWAGRRGRKLAARAGRTE